MSLSIGDRVPAFRLPDTEGAEHALPDGTSSAAVVVFTCNHCPYALAWHDRILDAARDYADRGVRFLAINPNDGAQYPRDSLEAMQARVREEDWPLPYLHDESQEVARDFDATATPEVFVVDGDGALRYHGAPDADYADPSRGGAWMRDAIDAVLEGRGPDPAETQAVGCSIKWKQ
jgi:peroxiredoxin